MAAERRFIGGENRFVGYRARVGIRIQLRNLDALENVVSGLVEAGANEIESIEFQSSQLKSLRAEARTMATAAAREKANLYAGAAGIRLGRIIHIQDVNPDVMNMFHRQSRGHFNEPVNPEVDAESEVQSLDPAAIQVHAAVVIAFAIE